MEDTELTLTIQEPGDLAPTNPIQKFAGAWVGLVDCDQLLEDTYASRRRPSERSVQLGE